MNKGIILFLIVVLFHCNVSQGKDKNKKINELAIDLASANIKLRGIFRLSQEYKGDLSKLNYNQYLEALKKNETKSDKGIAKKVRKANNHVFAVKSNSFLIAIYSKKLKVVLCDDANTMRLDSIKIVGKNDNIPNLLEFISGAEFQIVDCR